jgi:hypothetical protein
MDHVAWANRVNARWIVHHNLNHNATAYLAHLAQVDQGRLAMSCRNAQRMVEQAEFEDPKPWFYAGLFSLATADEAATYLAAHWLTNIVRDTAKQVATTGPERVSESTAEKIRRLQAALAKLPSGPP